MFEDAMKRYLRKRGYRIRRGRRPAGAVKRILTGSIIGSIVGYIFDDKTISVASRVLNDPSVMSSILGGANIGASAAVKPPQPFDDFYWTSPNRTHQTVGIPRDGYRKIGAGPDMQAEAYVAPGALTVAIRIENVLVVLTADEVTDLLDMIGEEIRKAKDDPPFRTFGGDESDVEAAEEAFGRGTPAAEAIKGYRRVKVQAPIHKDLKPDRKPIVTPDGWTKVSPLVEAMAVMGDDDAALIRVRFEGGDSGYVDMTQADIAFVDVFIKTGLVPDGCKLEMKKTMGFESNGLIVVADPKTKHAVELDRGSIKLVRDVFNAAYF